MVGAIGLGRDSRVDVRGDDLVGLVVDDLAEIGSDISIRQLGDIVLEDLGNEAGLGADGENDDRVDGSVVLVDEPEFDRLGGVEDVDQRVGVDDVGNQFTALHVGLHGRDEVVLLDDEAGGLELEVRKVLQDTGIRSERRRVDVEGQGDLRRHLEPGGLLGRVGRGRFEGQHGNGAGAERDGIEHPQTESVH